MCTENNENPILLRIVPVRNEYNINRLRHFEAAQEFLCAHRIFIFLQIKNEPISRRAIKTKE